MPAIQKNKKHSSKKTLGVVDPKVGSYEKHPFFVKKANEDREFLKTAGFPRKKLTKSK
jgi:hypothetical protein